MTGVPSKNEQQPIFSYDKCIRCYYSQELCPHDAIKLRRPLIVRVLDGK